MMLQVATSRDQDVDALIKQLFGDGDRAMCGRGEFTLHLQYAWHRVTVDVWRSMTEV